MRRWIAGLVLPSNDAPPAVAALASPHYTAVRLGPSINDPKMPTTAAGTNYTPRVALHSFSRRRRWSSAKLKRF